MLSPKAKINIQKIIPFGLIWLLSGWIFLIVELAASDSYEYLPKTAIKVDFQIFVMSSFALSIVGLITGWIEIKHLNKIFKHKKFGFRLLFKLLVYSILFFIVILVFYPIAASLELDTNILDKRIWDSFLHYFVSLTNLSTVIQLASSLILSLFYSEINDFVGYGVLKKFFIGKYHSPVEEERIFMFADMKSSTMIAEQLGHLDYFNLLREYYNCFTDAIINYEAEIYQYVGDEIILSWKFNRHKKDKRCIDCFFAMKKRLKEKEGWFRETFGVSPSFKAGIHFGKITVGEIGAIKKDILFLGDVLNVAARIQGLCNTNGVDLIVSDDLLEQLELGYDYEAFFLGKGELRGKEERKELHTIYLK